jgi:hypothetical protein
MIIPPNEADDIARASAANNKTFMKCLFINARLLSLLCIF